ncbi:MAG: AAA family ATPase [Elusimicrobia bacterium]|nr:AAA family ATPase [Elusimicrobiota bacterium]
MYLKSIELVGFKSFANKTYIDLKEGVTGIVGPNGCGKSNIVDAFRWCLGEMSAKSLRSKQMLDVIFAGSSGKAAMNLSEVTLTFDNSHHILPIDFTEVQVTRRLFRSGESEYFLNKTQCRLKDIRDLFLDTGIGEGYSILAQGEVDFVINAKPEERRELFEEAAGISKYKARREETLRKLEKVDMDLSRLSDIVSLTKEQMDSLESAAKKAQSYQKLKAELKVLEVTDYLNQMSRLEEEIQDKQKKIDQFKQEILEATTALDKSEADLTQNRIQQDQCDKELFERNTALLHLDKEIDHSDQMLKVSKERESEFREKEKKTQEQIELDRGELKNIEAKLETVKAELSRSQKEAEELQSHFEKEKETWKSLESERNTFDNSKRKLSDLILKLAGDRNELINEKNRYTSLLLNKGAEILSSQKELEKYAREEMRLRAEVEQIEQNLKELAENCLHLETETRSLQEQCRTDESFRSESLSKIQKARDSLIQQETRKQVLDQDFLTHPYRKGTQAILNGGFPGIKGVVGLLFKYSDTVAPWVESVLGHKLNSLVFETLAEAQQAIQWLKENQAGRAHCFVLERIPTVQPLDLRSSPNANSLCAFVHCAPEVEKLKNYIFGSAFLKECMIPA